MSWKNIKAGILILLAAVISFANSGIAAALDPAAFEDNNIRWYQSCAGPTNGCGSQLRVASYNILGKSHTDGANQNSSLPTWSTRIVKVKDNILSEKVDVVGFQEFQGDQRKYLDDNLTGYERSTHGKEEDSIMWNTSRFVKTDEGTWKTTYFRGTVSEPWVKLKDTSTNQEFYFMSLHDPINNGKGNATVRYENATKHVEKIQKLHSDAPVIIVGDFNNGYRKNDGSGALSDEKTAYCVLSTSGMTDAADAAKKQDYKCSGDPRPDKGSNIGSKIDHIFMSEEITASKHYSIKKPQSGSDHVAVIADLTIAGNCSSNINVPDWAGMPASIDAPVGGPVNGRITAASINARAPNTVSAIGTVARGKPDFIALNEAYRTTVTQLENSTPGYGAWRPGEKDGSRGDPNQSINNLVLWKKDTWELVTSGQVKITEDDQVIFKGNNKTWDRFATWGIFKRKTDGAIIPFISTHMMTNPTVGGQWGDQPFTRIEQYELGVDILMELVRVLSAHGPVIVAGDMNNGEARNEPWSVVPKMQKIGYKYVSAGVDTIFYPKGTKIASSRTPYVNLSGDHGNKYIEAKIDMNGVGPQATSGSVPAGTTAGQGCTCDEQGSATVGDVDIDKLLRAIAQRESGGSPTAENASSSASGKYQYIDSTWQARKSIYPPSGSYNHAANAPEAVQDAVAYIEYAQKIKDFNGDLEKIAVTHYLGHVPTSEEEWNTVPSGGNTLTPKQYAEGFKRSYDTDEGSGIPLKYSEAPEFSKYSKTSGGSSSASGESSDCAGGEEGGFTDLDGISMFYQYKEPWASKDYGIGTIKECGCGPTSLAIAVKTLTGFDTDPKKMADWFVDNGGQVGGGSCASNWIWESKAGLFQSTYGIKITSISASAESIKSALSEEGTLVLMSQTSDGMFTSGGHIMLARGVNSDNKILVADPNSETFSKKSEGFTNSEIEAGLRAAWVIKKN